MAGKGRATLNVFLLFLSSFVSFLGIDWTFSVGFKNSSTNHVS